MHVYTVGRWVAKLVERLGGLDTSRQVTSSLGSNPDISQKCKMGDISKGVPVAITL